MANLRAAVSIHPDALRYLEIDGGADNLRVARSAVLPISRDGDWVGAIERLREQTGKIPPLIFGVPMRETMIRLVEYPRIPLEDAKQALQFDFDKYFTWPFSESAVDVCEVESPLPLAPGKMTMLVAACRNEIVSKILNVTERTGVTLAAIAPMRVAILRAVMGRIPAHKGAWYSFDADPDGLHFAFAFNDNGIFYRSGASRGALDLNSEDGISGIIDEVQRTMTFVGNQFKEVFPQRIVLSGLLAGNARVTEAVESSTELLTESVDPYKIWGLSGAERLDKDFEITFGLCVRNDVEGKTK